MQWRHLNHRPTGITIMAILQIIGGIFNIPAGILLLSFGGPFGLTGIISVVLGIFSFIMGYGLFSGKGWAWTYTIVLQFINIPLSIILNVAVSGDVTSIIGNIPGIILGIIIISYMFRQTTRTYFGKANIDI